MGIMNKGEFQTCQKKQEEIVEDSVVDSTEETEQEVSVDSVEEVVEVDELTN